MAPASPRLAQRHELRPWIYTRGVALEEQLAGIAVALLPAPAHFEKMSTATPTIARNGSASYASDITWDEWNGRTFRQPHPGSFTPG